MPLAMSRVQQGVCVAAVQQPRGQCPREGGRPKQVAPPPTQASRCTRSALRAPASLRMHAHRRPAADAKRESPTAAAGGKPGGAPAHLSRSSVLRALFSCSGSVARSSFLQAPQLTFLSLMNSA